MEILFDVLLNTWVFGKHETMCITLTTVRNFIDWLFKD